MLILLVPPDAEIVDVVVPPPCEIHPQTRSVACWEVPTGVPDMPECALNLCMSCGLKFGSWMLHAYRSPSGVAKVLRETEVNALLGGANMDKTTTCSRCGEEFTWTDSQQAYYAANGLSAPKKCKTCRKLKSYTQEELEQDLFVIETARHIARTQLVEGEMGGLQFNRVMDRLDAEEKRCTNRALMQKLDWIAGRQNAQRRQSSTSTPARRHAMLTQMEREKPQTFRQVSQQRAKE